MDREALSRMIDREQAAAKRCQDRGQFKAAQRHLDKAGRLLSA